MYLPTTILEFGANSGCTLKLVYKYVPEYIDYLMKEVDSFSINVEDFYTLPCPTPFYADQRYKIIFEDKVNEYYKTEVENFKEYAAYPASIKERTLFREPHDLAIQKAKVYFKVEGLERFPSVSFAVSMINALGFEPVKKEYIFSPKSVVENNKKLKQRSF